MTGVISSGVPTRHAKCLLWAINEPTRAGTLP
ncbi:hypothetical protein QE369_001931 [Agrobacterium larrymoorei]|uniref:Uncharacterized protein n=1 Tax=Agrobacterium larrymoorei TaxID=160699 RepID=A0AAJ2BF71_9HYPH|nr:hypothetical protein [Agrobacterium larrymoorei]